MEHFWYFICHLYIFSGKVSGKVLTHFLMGMFVFLLLISKYSLYILENNHLSGVSFVNIFLPACGLFLTLLIFFFGRKK